MTKTSTSALATASATATSLSNHDPREIAKKAFAELETSGKSANRGNQRLAYAVLLLCPDLDITQPETLRISRDAATSLFVDAPAKLSEETKESQRDRHAAQKRQTETRRKQVRRAVELASVLKVLKASYNALEEVFHLPLQAFEHDNFQPIRASKTIALDNSDLILRKPLEDGDFARRVLRASVDAVLRLHGGLLPKSSRGKTTKGKVVQDASSALAFLAVAKFSPNERPEETVTAHAFQALLNMKANPVFARIMREVSEGKTRITINDTVYEAAKAA